MAETNIVITCTTCDGWTACAIVESTNKAEVRDAAKMTAAALARGDRKLHQPSDAERGVLMARPCKCPRPPAKARSVTP